MTPWLKVDSWQKSEGGTVRAAPPDVLIFASRHYPGPEDILHVEQLGILKDSDGWFRAFLYRGPFKDHVGFSDPDSILSNRLVKILASGPTMEEAMVFCDLWIAF